MKKEFKIWLEPEDFTRLKCKAQEAGFDGKGEVSHYIEKVAREPICFLDDNVRRLLNSLNLTTK